MKTSVMTIVGARPQFVKASVVSKALAMASDFDEILVHTGQHFDDNMSAVFFDDLGIPQPAHHLGIGGGTHAANTGRSMEAIERLLISGRPDVVLVYGDTDSTLAGALAAAKLDVPVAHVEAGLRSFNRQMPEEINRVLTDHVATLLMAPTSVAVENLTREGISADRIRVTGDVMFDAVRVFSRIADEKSTILESLRLQPKQYILATVHRKENTDDRIRLQNVIAALSQSAIPVVLPLHPRTRHRIADFGIEVPDRVKLCEPVGYLDMLHLQKNASVIATDSGGVQKEAYFHGVPCVTLREETEWVELIEAGVNTLAGTDPERIAAALAAPRFELTRANLYGDGNASALVLEALRSLRAAG